LDIQTPEKRRGSINPEWGSITLEYTVTSIIKRLIHFLIIDQKELYHLGASLKDLGKKWLAFSKMDALTADVLAKLKNVK